MLSPQITHDGPAPDDHAEAMARGNSNLPPLVVVVVTHNSASVLPELLDSLPSGLDGTGPNRVLVVDNASRDASVELAVFHPVKPEVILAGKNAGYAAGINAATKVIAADADVLILNPDIRLRPGAARLLQHRLRRPGVGVAVPKIFHTDGSVALSLRREPSIATVWSEALLGGHIAKSLGTSEIVADPALYDRDCRVEWATGAALMVGAAARMQVGAWDESFFLYSEEVDYMRRIRECGLSIEYVCGSQVTHVGGQYMSDPFLSGLMALNRVRDYGRRHGYLQTACFRLGVAAGAAIRTPFGASHRAALRTVLSLRNSARQTTPPGPQRAV